MRMSVIADRSSRAKRLMKSPPAGKPGRTAQLLLYTKQLVVFCDAVRPACRTGLYLPCPGRHNQVSDERVLGLSGPVGDHSGEPCTRRHLHRLERFGQRADLVYLDEDRVRYSFSYAAGQPFGVGHEEVVSHKLDLLAQCFSEKLPAFPVVLRHTVFDRYDRVLVDPVCPEPDHIFRTVSALVRLLEYVCFFLAVIELARCRIKSKPYVLSYLVPCLTYGLQDHLDSFDVGLQVWRKSSFVAD